MTDEELVEVERLGNEIVQGNAAVETRLMAQEAGDRHRRPRAVRREIWR